MMRAERNPLVYKIGRALLRPELVIPKLKRALRNARIRLAHPNHIDFYREAMRAKRPRTQIGLSEVPTRSIGTRSVNCNSITWFNMESGRITKFSR